MTGPGEQPPAPQQPAALTSLEQPVDPAPDLATAQLTELDDEARQAEYRRQFLIQMQRRSCPGCGDW
jgi:hypothetical protein